MKNYLKHFIENFDIDESNIFFGYIFSDIKKDKKEFDAMIKSCEFNKLSYCFYDFSKKCLFSKDFSKILNNISKIVTWPFQIKPKIVEKVKRNDKILFSDFHKDTPKYQLTDLEKNKILEIVREYIDPNLSLLTFKKTSIFNTKFLDIKNNIGYTSISSSQISKKKNKYLIFKKSKSIYIFDLNNNKKNLSLSSTAFDFYSII